MRTAAMAIPVTAVSLLVVLSASAGGRELEGPQPKTVQSSQPARQAAMNAHLSMDDRLGDLMAHPAFAGFAPLLLPRTDLEIDQNAKLGRIGSLLPYHQNVEPSDVVKGLNRLIDDAGAGRQVFFDIYTESEKQQEPSRKQTGLFFFRGRPGAPFAVIAPGGGFSYVGSVHEGFPYAVEINKRGYNAFVLRYRVGYGGTAATQDLAAAVSYIFRNAGALQVSTENYSLWGSSAGARMAAAIGTHGVARYGGNAIPKPSTVVMAYTGHSEYSADDPPTFAVVGARDGIASPATMERRVQALKQAGVTVEYHKYPAVGHGFGLGTGTSAEGWIGDAVRFWERAGINRTSNAR
ncbi:MAG: alpha/beta hydrolase [Betaproteobacteria bacterium]|nr:alpha/beta hydrolase [Betaproteobacteria bacterium]